MNISQNSFVDFFKAAAIATLVALGFIYIGSTAFYMLDQWIVSRYQTAFEESYVPEEPGIVSEKLPGLGRAMERSHEIAATLTGQRTGNWVNTLLIILLFALTLFFAFSLSSVPLNSGVVIGGLLGLLSLNFMISTGGGLSLLTCMLILIYLYIYRDHINDKRSMIYYCREVAIVLYLITVLFVLGISFPLARIFIIAFIYFIIGWLLDYETLSLGFFGGGIALISFFSRIPAFFVQPSNMVIWWSISFASIILGTGILYFLKKRFKK